MAQTLKEKMRAAFRRFRAHDLAGTEQLCVEILRDSPRYPDAMHLLGMVRLAAGNAGEAVSLISGALEGKPSDPVALEHLGLARVAQKDYAAAEAAFREVIAKGGRTDALEVRLAMALSAQGKRAEALAMLRKTAAATPDVSDIQLNIGNLLAAEGVTEEAFACYNRVLALQPGNAVLRFNLGNMYASLGRLEEAAAIFEQALTIIPYDADARNNLGIVYQKLGKPDDAAASYRRALDANPRHTQAWHNLGTVHSERGEFRDAAAAYRRSLQIAPSQAAVHNDLGSALRDSGDFEGAIAAYQQAIAIDPQSVAALYNLAETLKVPGRFDEAIAAYERALAIKPDYFQALNGLTYLHQHICDWNGIETLWKRLRDTLGKPGSGASPFSVLYMPTSAEEQLACSEEWARQTLGYWIARRADLGINPPRTPRERPRIGYLSWDFHEHATSYLIAELFELHDRGRFEVYAYSYGPDDGSAIRARIKSACEHFVDIAGNFHLEAARRIRGDGIDILVDLKGYTLGSRPQITALRPAPVQVNWLGFPGSMGTDSVDYIIADPFIVPAGTERHFSERVVRLPDCYQVNDRKRQISERMSTRGENSLPAEGVVLCCFNQTAKILPDLFACWMRIMHAVPGSVLWLLESNRWAAENLRRAAAAHGIAGERLLFAPRRPLAEHLARYRAADLAIDTFPYTSHTTASDALWAGCPLVTHVGDTFVSRVAGSILRNAGMHELVTGNAGDYERKVIELATAPGKLRDLRRKLQETRDRCTLFDTPLFVRNLEGAYEDMLKALRDRGPMYNPSGSGNRGECRAVHTKGDVHE
jgi:protein O-GlcNAc transferase